MKNVFLLLLLVITACSSTRAMRGTEARPLGETAVENLKLTLEPVPDLSLEGYRLVNVYFRNLNEEWLQIKSVDVVSVDGAPHFKVVVGEDLKAWRKSMALDIDLRLDHEKDGARRAQLIELKNRLDRYKEEDYVYGPFRLPSMLQTQKWLLLQMSKHEEVKALNIQLTFIDSSKQVYAAKAGAKP